MKNPGSIKKGFALTRDAAIDKTEESIYRVHQSCNGYYSILTFGFHFNNLQKSVFLDFF